MLTRGLPHQPQPFRIKPTPATQNPGETNRIRPVSNLEITILIRATAITLCAKIIKHCAKAIFICAEAVFICAKTVFICTKTNFICAKAIILCAMTVLQCAIGLLHCAKAVAQIIPPIAQSKTSNFHRIPPIPTPTKPTIHCPQTAFNAIFPAFSRLSLIKTAAKPQSI